MDGEIDKKELKKKAFEILLNLKELALKENLYGYRTLKQDFQNLMEIIFSPNYIKNKDYDSWDFARNQLDNILTSKMLRDTKHISKGKYEKIKDKSIRIFLESIIDIEKSLI